MVYCLGGVNLPRFEAVQKGRVLAAWTLRQIGTLPGRAVHVLAEETSDLLRSTHIYAGSYHVLMAIAWLST